MTTCKNVFGFSFTLQLHMCVVPEHLVQFVGGHAAAIISERQTEVTGYIDYIYPDLFGGDAGI